VRGLLDHPTLIQTGTEQDVINGVAHYSAWWETIPAPLVRTTLPVHAGDRVVALGAVARRKDVRRGGAPPLVAALLLAFFSNLNGGLTHYGTGSAPVFFNAGYVDQGTWWRLGFVISVVNLMIWFGLGLFWWQLLDLW